MCIPKPVVDWLLENSVCFQVNLVAMRVLHKKHSLWLLRLFADFCSCTEDWSANTHCLLSLLSLLTSNETWRSVMQYANIYFQSCLTPNVLLLHSAYFSRCNFYFKCEHSNFWFATHYFKFHYFLARCLRLLADLWLQQHASNQSNRNDVFGTFYTKLSNQLHTSDCLQSPAITWSNWSWNTKIYTHIHTTASVNNGP